MFSARIFSVFAPHRQAADASDSIPSEWAATCSAQANPHVEGDSRQQANGTAPAFAATQPMGLPAA